MISLISFTFLPLCSWTFTCYYNVLNLRYNCYAFQHLLRATRYSACCCVCVWVFFCVLKFLTCSFLFHLLLVTKNCFTSHSHWWAYFFSIRFFYKGWGGGLWLTGVVGRGYIYPFYLVITKICCVAPNFWFFCNFFTFIGVNLLHLAFHQSVLSGLCTQS